MKKVLITGATGFIGRHCLPLLRARDYEIHAVSTKIPEKGSADIHWYQVDLLEADDFSNLIVKVNPTHFLHLAWYVVPGKSWNSHENLRWLNASIRMLQSFAEQGGERVVIAGTCAEYDWNYGYLSEKTTPLKPSTLYGISKHSLQMILDVFGQQVGISSAWGRIFYLYGPYEHPKRLVSSIILSLLQDKPAYCSHGNQIRDYLYIEDAADALVMLMESDIQGAVNIASGNPVSLKEIILKITDKLNHKDLIHLGAIPTSADEPAKLIADVKRLTDEVGWSPKYNMVKGLDNTIEWWRNRIRFKN